MQKSTSSLERARELTETTVPDSADLGVLEERLMAEMGLALTELHVMFMRPERTGPFRAAVQTLRQEAEQASRAGVLQGTLADEAANRAAASEIARMLAWLDTEVFGRVETQQAELGFVPPGDQYRAATLIQTAVVASRSLIHTGDARAMGHEELELIDEQREVRRSLGR